VPQCLGVNLLLQVVSDILDTDGGMESFAVRSGQVFFGWSPSHLPKVPANHGADESYKADEGENCLDEAHQDCPPL
jgi:hypothetical protein